MHATKYSYREIKKNIEEEEAQAIREYITENKTSAYLYLTPGTKRYYPYSGLAAQALGFVNDEGGAYGIEAAYNDVLEGTAGRWSPPRPERAPRCTTHTLISWTPLTAMT